MQWDGEINGLLKYFVMFWVNAGGQADYKFMKIWNEEKELFMMMEEQNDPQRDFWGKYSFLLFAFLLSDNTPEVFGLYQKVL